jgi:hypothetical protein
MTGSRQLHDAIKRRRRDFFKSATLAAAGLTFSPMPVMAGPFDQEDWNTYIPADKKLHPDWVKSLSLGSNANKLMTA